MPQLFNASGNAQGSEQSVAASGRKLARVSGVLDGANVAIEFRHGAEWIPVWTTRKPATQDIAFAAGVGYRGVIAGGGADTSVSVDIDDL